MARNVEHWEAEASYAEKRAAMLATRNPEDASRWLAYAAENRKRADLARALAR